MFCVGLFNKSYHILNEQYTPEEYAELVKKMRNNLEYYTEQFYLIATENPRCIASNFQSQDCIGNMLFNCSESTYSFDAM